MTATWESPRVGRTCAQMVTAVRISREAFSCAEAPAPQLPVQPGKAQIERRDAPQPQEGPPGVRVPFSALMLTTAILGTSRSPRTVREDSKQIRRLNSTHQHSGEVYPSGRGELCRLPHEPESCRSDDRVIQPGTRDQSSQVPETVHNVGGIQSAERDAQAPVPAHRSLAILA